MKTELTFDHFSIEDGVKLAQLFAASEFSKEMETVLRVALSDFNNLPGLRIREKGTISFKLYIEKWVSAYRAGLANRPSCRQGKQSNTISDPLVKVVLGARVPKLTQEDLNMIELGHSTMMTIENLIGDLLEEYLSVRLKPQGWHCAWGSTLDAVDFCKLDGSLLQIKNSDNSENSSSSQVRRGRPIEKWFRRFSTRRDIFNWAALVQMIPGIVVGEDDFRAFVSEIIQNNNAAIYLPPYSF